MDALGWSQAPFRKLRLEPPAAAVVGLHRDGPREGDCCSNALPQREGDNLHWLGLGICNYKTLTSAFLQNNPTLTLAIPVLLPNPNLALSITVLLFNPHLSI